jgi:hypothetical protein
MKHELNNWRWMLVAKPMIDAGNGENANRRDDGPSLSSTESDAHERAAPINCQI